MMPTPTNTWDQMYSLDQGVPPAQDLFSGPGYIPGLRIHGVSTDTGCITLSMVYQQRRNVSSCPKYIHRHRMYHPVHIESTDTECITLSTVYPQIRNIPPCPWYIHRYGIYHLLHSTSKETGCINKDWVYHLLHGTSTQTRCIT